MKICNNCKELKNFSEFNKDKSKKDGLQTFCRNCKRKKDKEYAAKNREAAQKRAREWYANNTERANESSKKWRKANPEKMRAYKNKWIEENKELHRERGRAWKKTNSAKVLASTRMRQAAKLKATPPWLTEEHKFIIQEIYDLRKLRSELTGVEHHVDHIVPLKSKKVCGLHVPWNLQVIPAKQNLAKSNTF